jgi:MinD superfamily P-loop ATPase
MMLTGTFLRMNDAPPVAPNAAVCLVHKIEIVDGKPVWKHHCELCCACIHLCLVEAIQYGQKIRRRGRYRHPSLTTADMKE